MKYQGLIKKYRDYLPTDEAAIISLYEGNTPLIPVKNLVHKLGLNIDLYLKYEGLNPTGSFKDRGMTYAVSKAVEKKSHTIICASTGNTSASAAAYAGRAGMRCVVLIPAGKIAYGKLSQAIIHGADVVQIKGNFDQALQIVLDMGQNYPIEVVNSVNPNRLLGQMTAAFEISEYLNRAPDYHFLPVGNAGNITAYWMGYKKWFDEGKIKSKPKMMGFQAEGAAPIVLGHPVAKPETIATAIRIGNPASWKGAQAARDESGGMIDKISDAEIVAAYQLVAKYEGIFCEPASAISIAGVIKKAKEENIFRGGEVVVCTLTGHGLKDPDTAIQNSPKPLNCVADYKKLAKLLKI
ncbi:MAG: hypothetical protein ACD_73C00155G0005 [uncultured bacterium]|nr:MAG: hypothetical protein ACD_73C00155G0005 [uncultured bacterium]